MACLNTATRGPLAYVSKRRWLGFQLCSLLVACIMTAVIAPVFIFSLRPQREREQAPGKTMCGPTFRDQGAEYCRILEAAKTSSEAQRGVWKYSSSAHQNATFSRANWYNNSIFYMTNGVVDLTLMAKTLDPDAMTITMAVHGAPYGFLAAVKNPTGLALRVPSLEDPSEPAALLGCNQPDRGTPQCADLRVLIGRSQLSYVTGDKLTYSTLTTDIDSINALDCFPYDSYRFKGYAQVTASFLIPDVLALRTADEARVATAVELGQLTDGSIPVPFRLQLVPALTGWRTKIVNLSLVPNSITTVSAGFADAPAGGKRRKYVANSTEEYLMQVEVVYERNLFVKVFTVLLLLLMSIMSIYLLVLAIDHVMVRPRQLQPDTVGYSVGMLFALPTLRMLMDAPLGSYIDLACFAWCMVLVAIAVVLFFSASYAEHKHKAKVFKRADVPQNVFIVEESTRDLTENLRAVLDKMTEQYHKVLKKQLSEKLSASRQSLHAGSIDEGAGSGATGLLEVIDDDDDVAGQDNAEV